MTDDLSAYGLGALPDAPDERDYPLSALDASEGITASVVLPATYVAPGMPPVLDPHATPSARERDDGRIDAVGRIGNGRGERHSPATIDHLVMRLAEPPEPCEWLRSA